MDNVKNDTYFANKIRDDLIFIVNYTKNIDEGQDVNKVYRRIDGGYVLVECKYTEDWDLDKKRSVAKQICSDEYITFIALENDRVVGFIGLLRKLSGPYMILDMIEEPFDLQMICPMKD